MEFLDLTVSWKSAGKKFTWFGSNNRSRIERFLLDERLAFEVQRLISIRPQVHNIRLPSDEANWDLRPFKFFDVCKKILFLLLETDQRMVEIELDSGLIKIFVLFSFSATLWKARNEAILINKSTPMSDLVPPPARLVNSWLLGLLLGIKLVEGALNLFKAAIWIGRAPLFVERSLELFSFGSRSLYKARRIGGKFFKILMSW
ncbi:hypothetical protein V6N13_032468 [Hibiscus sabdariffa]